MDEQNARVASPPETEMRTREIRAEIDRTRDDISETVDAIQDRLRPSSIAANTAERVKEAATSRMHDMANSETASYVNDNRMPIAMVGIGVAGLAWLMSRNGNGGDYRRRPSRQSWRTTGREDWRSTPGYRPSHLAEPGAYDPVAGGYEYRPIPETAPIDLTERYQGTARSNYSRPNYMQRAWHANPLLVGAAAAAVGAMVGLGVPETERENELMGETRDQMIGSISDTVRSKVEDVQQAATSAVNTVQEVAKQSVGMSNTSEENRRPGGQS
jgi:hypothetical protein